MGFEWNVRAQLATVRSINDMSFFLNLIVQVLLATERPAEYIAVLQIMLVKISGG